MAMDEEQEEFCFPVSNEPTNFESHIGKRPSTPALAQQEAETRALQLRASQIGLPEVLRGKSAEVIQAAIDQLLDAAMNEEVLNDPVALNEPVDTVRYRKPPYSNHRMWAPDARVELIDPTQAALLKLNLSDKRELALKETDITAVKPSWEEWGILPSKEGAKLATGRKDNWNYIVNPKTGQAMTPGFDRIEAVSNEGMVGFLAATNGYYLVTAQDLSQAVKRHLGLSKEAEALVAYPFFLQAPELRVTRFNPEDVQSGADPILNQLLGRDPFRLQKRPLHPMDLEARKNFDRLAGSIHDYTAQYGAVMNTTVEGQQGFSLPPVDTDELSAQMLMTFHDNGTRVISLHDISENDVLDPGGFHLVQGAAGGLVLVDSRLEKVLSDFTSSEYKSLFVQSSNLIHRYLDSVKAARTKEIVTRTPHKWEKVKKVAMAALQGYALMYSAGSHNLNFPS